MPDAIEGAEYTDTVFGLDFTVNDLRSVDDEPTVELEYEDGQVILVALATFKQSDGIEIDPDSI